MYNLEIYESPGQEFHYTLYVPGKPNSRASAPTICGITDFSGMRKAAAFPVGDRRGAVHFERACGGCVQGLSDTLDMLEGYPSPMRTLP